MFIKFKNEFYAIDKNSEVYLVDRKGNVLNKRANSKSNLGHDVGVNDWKYAVRSSVGGHAPAYALWRCVLQRSCNEKFKVRYPTYENVTVCDDWTSFTAFFYDTKVYMKHGYQLDKDLLFYGNKEYTKNSCIFVPSWLNSLLLDSRATRGNLPQGVVWNEERGKYQARCAVDGRLKHIGRFANVEKASNAYINFKLDHIESKRLDIEAVALHNNLHLRFGSDFSLTDRVIENFKQQVMIFNKLGENGYVQK